MKVILTIVGFVLIIVLMIVTLAVSLILWFLGVNKKIWTLTNYFLCTTGDLIIHSYWPNSEDMPEITKYDN